MKRAVKTIGIPILCAVFTGCSHVPTCKTDNFYTQGNLRKLCEIIKDTQENQHQDKTEQGNPNSTTGSTKTYAPKSA